MAANRTAVYRVSKAQTLNFWKRLESCRLNNTTNTKVLVVFVCVVIYSIIARRIVSGIYACVFLKSRPFSFFSFEEQNVSKYSSLRGQSPRQHSEFSKVLISNALERARNRTRVFAFTRALNSGRVQDVRTHSWFGLLLKVPSNASKLSHESEKVSVHDRLKNSYNSLKEAFESLIIKWSRKEIFLRRLGRVCVTKKNQKKRKKWCNSSVILIRSLVPPDGSVGEEHEENAVLSQGNRPDPRSIGVVF